MSENVNNNKNMNESKIACPYFKKCGSCQLLSMSYEEQLKWKQKQVKQLLGSFCPVYDIAGMDNPWHYRNKVHGVIDRDKKGNLISGIYEENSHRVVPVDQCLIEDEKADEIIRTICSLGKSFKIKSYDEDTGYGLLRHVLIRKGFVSGQIMVVLVTASPIFPSKNNFVKALRERHPEITTIVQNINPRGTSMVLGNKNVIMYGKGYIEDTLCGNVFRISPDSFYQINSQQTEVLYNQAIKAAKLTGKERVIDAYCGIGTIGITASRQAKEVIGVELNSNAVKDAIHNAKRNGVENIRFYQQDAGEFMKKLADQGEHVDVVLMDPPRSGSTEQFIDAVEKMAPDRVVYISCNPETQARDLKYFKKKGYTAKGCWPVDMFPGTYHV
ncbi:MAG: 23S rRNA (uracil(1939)-C(5))-methyltransferase RlmD, partial [Lachnospiraceae bacterium]